MLLYQHEYQTKHATKEIIPFPANILAIITPKDNISHQALQIPVVRLQMYVALAYLRSYTQDRLNQSVYFLRLAQVILNQNRSGLQHWGTPQKDSVNMEAATIHWNALSSCYDWC